MGGGGVSQMYVVKHHTKNKERIIEKFAEYVKVNQQKKGR